MILKVKLVRANCPGSTLQDAVKEARKSSGLGVSQTVEVAYLDKEGFEYEEHDIAEFQQFMNAHEIR